MQASVTNTGTTSRQQWPKSYLAYDVTHKKTPNEIFFFIADLKMCSLLRV